MLDQVDTTLSVPEAAEHFGVSDKTIRRWIKGGKLKGNPMKTPQGYEWRIRPGDVPDQADVHLDDRMDSTGDQPDDRMNDQVAMAALALAEEVRGDKEQMREDYQRLQQQNLELAGRCGYLQAKLEAAEQKMLALAAPQEPGMERPRIPWWKRALGLAGA